MTDRPYTLYLLDDFDRPLTFEVLRLQGPDAARAKALQLMAERPRYFGVEVSDGRSQFIVERPH